MYNVTKPSDLRSENNENNENLLLNALELFENKLKLVNPKSSYFFLVITEHLDKTICKKIEEIYKNAGWSKVECINSFDNGERYGLTGLKLWK